MSCKKPKTWNKKQKQNKNRQQKKSTIWVTIGSVTAVIVELLMISVEHVVNNHMMARIADGGKEESPDIAFPNHSDKPDFWKDFDKINKQIKMILLWNQS